MAKRIYRELSQEVKDKISKNTSKGLKKKWQDKNYKNKRYCNRR